MFSITSGVIIAFAIAVGIVLYGVMRPLYDHEAVKSAFAGMRPNFRYRETYRANMEKRREAANQQC